MSAADVVRLAEQRAGRSAGPDRTQTEPGAGHSWQRVDLAAVLAADYQPPQPTVLARADGQRLFYPGRTGSLFGESESAKTWLALLAAVEQIRAGHRVLMVDFEDDAAGAVGRLLALGLTAVQIRQGFDYRRPEGPLSETAWRDLALDLADPALPPCTLAVIDGITEGLSMHGLAPNADVDVATFHELLPRRLAALGPAVVLIDHVVKAVEARGRWATGSQHKISGLTGSAFIVEPVRPFGIGLTGSSRIFLAKDRPGAIRPQAVPGAGGRHWVGDFTMASDSRGRITQAAVTRPDAERERDPFRPTVLMERISRHLEAASEAASGHALELAVLGKASHKRAALELLVAEGFVRRETRGQAQMHRSARPYRQEAAP